MNLLKIVDWDTFKALIVTNSLIYRYLEFSTYYTVYAVDRPFVFECSILKDSGTPQTEFEATYKGAAYTTFSQFDTDGAGIVRPKAAKRGWTYMSLPLEFQTSRLSDTLYAKDVGGVDRAGITLKAYNASDVEVTTPGLLNANYATITKTVIDIELPYDIEIIGGSLRTVSSISDDIRLWIIAVPDVAAASGGSKEMVGGMNLKYLSPGNMYSVDGRVAKALTYNSTYHTNKIRFILKYTAGTTEELMLNLEIYKQ